MKVAVFGATGMVGSAIVEEGRGRGHEVRTVSSREGAAEVVAVAAWDELEAPHHRRARFTVAS